MKFKDAQLQQCYDRNLVAAGDASEDLRRGYRRSGAKTDSAAIEFREQLSQLAGERLKITVEISHNPT